MDGLVAPFSVDFTTSGFLSPLFDTWVAGLAGRFIESGLSAGLTERPDAPTLDDVGRDPGDLRGADDEGFAGPVLDGAVTEDDFIPAILEVDVVGFETPVFET